MTADHARELAEDAHAYEEAVANATERVCQAEVNVLGRAMDLYRSTADGCDTALRALQQACHGYELAERAYDDAIDDRDRHPGRA